MTGTLQEQHKLIPVIVSIADKDLRKTIRKVVDGMGMRTVTFAVDDAKCRESLTKHPDGLLLIDWQKQKTVGILNRSRGKMFYDPRPIYLFVEEPDSEFLRIMTDYQVNMVHTGTFEESKIREKMSLVLDENSVTNVFRKKMNQVAKAERKGGKAKALALIEEMFEATPQNVQLGMEYCWRLIQADRWDEAESIIDDFLEASCDVPRMMYMKSRCSMHRRDYDSAVKYMKKSTLLNPHHAERLLGLGNLYLRQNLAGPAKASFQKAIKAGAETEGRRGEASATFLAGDFDEGINLVKAMADDREKAAVYNNTGVICVKYKEFDRARQLYEVGAKMIKDRPLKAMIVFNKSLCLMKSGEPAQAMEVCREAMTLNPEYARAKELLGRLEVKAPARPAVQQKKQAAGAEDLLPVDEVEGDIELDDELDLDELDSLDEMF